MHVLDKRSYRKYLKLSLTSFMRFLIICVVFPAKRESWCWWEREGNVSIPAICLVVSRLPAGKRSRVRDVPAICVFWRVSSSSEPDVSTPETREAQPAVSGFGFPQHSPPSPLRVEFSPPPERIVTNANNISYAFFFRFTPSRSEEERTRVSLAEGGLLA